MKLTDVIRRPLVTEKTSIMREDGRTIVFHVSRDANKVEIKRAIEQLLGAKVESIRTTIAHGKIKRQGRYFGRRPDWKKAYVKLREGAKMPRSFLRAFASSREKAASEPGNRRRIRCASPRRGRRARNCPSGGRG